MTSQVVACLHRESVTHHFRTGEERIAGAKGSSANTPVTNFDWKLRKILRKIEKFAAI